MRDWGSASHDLFIVAQCYPDAYRHREGRSCVSAQLRTREVKLGTNLSTCWRLYFVTLRPWPAERGLFCDEIVVKQ